MLSAAAAAVAPHGAQRLQVRQVLSVYVDNRCRCGDRHHHHPGTDGGQQHRPQSFPMGGGGGGGGEGLYAGAGLYAPLPQQRLVDTHCRHCLAQQQLVNYACHYAQQQQQQSGVRCHTAADDDNAINQSIYMSAKEARIQQQQMLLYAKNQSLMVVAGPRNIGIDSGVKDTASAAPSVDVVPTDAPQQKETSSVPREGEVASANQSSSPPIGVELPASFDSVTLKRMLRSLSGSPLLDRTSVGLSGPADGSKREPVCEQPDHLSNRSDDANIGLLSQRQEENADLKLDSSSSVIQEPLSVSHLQESKELVVRTSETVVEKPLDVDEETAARSVEAGVLAQCSPKSVEEDKPLPNGCVTESVKCVLSETLPSEGAQVMVKVTRDANSNDGETSVEHSLDESHGEYLFIFHLIVALPQKQS